MSQSEDPFKHPDFLSNILLWIGKLDADQFRRAVQSKGFFTDVAQLQELQRVKKYEGNEPHNSQIINIIQPGGELAYRLLCDAIREMSPLHDNMYRKMIILLPEDQLGTTDDQLGTTDVPEHSFTSSASNVTIRGNVDTAAANSRATNGTVTCDALAMPDDEAVIDDERNPHHVRHLHTTKIHSCATSVDHSDLMCCATHPVHSPTCSFSNTATDGAVIRNHVTLAMNDDVADNGGGHIQCLKQHLDRVNTHLCLMTADLSDPTCLSGNVKDCFVSMQALTEKDALQLTYRAQQPATLNVTGRHPISDRTPGVAIPGARQDKNGKVEGSSFLLSSAKQVLSYFRCHDDVTDKGKSGVGVDTIDAGVLESCFVIGNAGQGKTTLCKRVIVEIMETTTGNLAKIKFIFYVPCCYVERLQSADWGVFLGLDHLRISAHEQSELLHYLSEHSDQVLIVIDGIDELGSDGLGNKSVARAVLRRERSLLPDAIIFATSRPCSTSYGLVSNFRLRFRLVGFSRAQLNEFVYRHLGEEEGYRCIEELCQTTHYSMYEAIRRTPLLCVLLVQQYAITCSFPGSIAALLEQFLYSTVYKLELRRGKKFGKVRLTRAVTSHLHGMRKFGQEQLVDIETVICHQLEGDVDDNVGDVDCDYHAVQLVNALKALYELCLKQYQLGAAAFKVAHTNHHLRVYQNLGLLVTAGGDINATMNSSCLVSLAHLTIQEYCATRAIVSSSSCVEDAKHCISTIGLGTNTRVFWKFLFGSLRPELLCPMLDAIQGSSRFSNGKVSKMMLLFLMNCLQESRLSLERGILSSEVYIEQASYNAKLRTYFESASKLLAEDGIDVEGVPLEAIDAMAIHNTLHFIDLVKMLNVSRCNLPSDVMCLLSSQLSKCVEVHIGRNDLDGAPLRCISSGLLSSESTPHLQVLDVSNTALTSRPVAGATLATCVNYSGLVQLNACNTCLGNDGLSAFVTYLIPCTNLTVLSMAYCDLYNGCGSDLTTLVTKLPHLEQLRLDNNSLSNSEFSCVLSGLRSHDMIRHLHFENNKVNDAVIASIIDFLQARRHREPAKMSGNVLRRLWTSMYENYASGTTGGAATSHLPALPTCAIYLTGCGVTVRLLQKVTESRQCGGDIVDIGSRYATGASVETRSFDDLVSSCGGGAFHDMVDDSMMIPLGNYLTVNNDLDLLDISACGITDTGAITLATSGLARNTSIKCINVDGNRIQLAGVAALLQALSIPRSQVNALSLAGNPVFHDPHPSHAVCQLLLDLLSDAHRLRVISFAGTGMCDEVGAGILRALRSHTCIGWLDMSCNDIGRGTVRALVEMKKSNTSLKVISLVECKITHNDVNLLLHSPGVMSTGMDKVYLCKNPCSPDPFRQPLDNTAPSLRMADILEYIS
ncbi:uncharacterized protein LOC135818539 [Sycon ciliatum]|uniref:uncharacterized protein LOC135818539 n=1 Tax=Sycon ciliatum TaxID=27933 RepID=UPI0031F61C1F